MQLSDIDYHLPPELIADRAIEPRDQARLLVLDRQTGQIMHRRFSDIAEHLTPGDVLVMNNSKVIPARLIGRKEMTGGQVELLLEYEVEPGLWRVIGKKITQANRIIFDDSPLEAAVEDKRAGHYLVRFNMIGAHFMKEIDRIGQVPLPPYIVRKRRESATGLVQPSEHDKDNYQTVYASTPGSVAAPTAGLHFTERLLLDLKQKNIETVFLTLHVGYGTFAPIKDSIDQHVMHSEFYHVDASSLNTILRAKEAGRRIIAVGTTTTRVLEHLFAEMDKNPHAFALQGWTNIFITPGYNFKCIDGLITNFHLPKSTLLLLVSALAGHSNIMRAYKEAISKQYRFYSYGDAMLII
ncbi:MAG: S-adenosylmethionine:tRNA ribosyltransferase-isomerase [bacterium ADurb.Bin400]|nr:MAG: S-adenosylmethionine:tRNA ribosyltransferase-isomerase [bacterium ADurb.Bin400]